MPVYIKFVISCTHGLWLREIFFYKEMGSFEKQTDLEQNWTDSFSAFRY